MEVIYIIFNLNQDLSKIMSREIRVSDGNRPNIQKHWNIPIPSDTPGNID